VVPAIIRRVHEAKVNNSIEVVIWGSGLPRREFLYVDDMAEASLFIHNLDPDVIAEQTNRMCSHINVGTGFDITIRELAETIQEIIGFKGNFNFDSSKPDGTPRKLLNVDLLTRLGWTPKVSLKTGLQLSYEDFLSRFA